MKQLEEKIKSEFLSKFTVWNDKYKYATLQGKEEYPTPEMIADWWLSALASQKEAFIKEITGEKLHEYYLKAIEFVKPDSYNPNAVRPFKDLSLKQQQIDEYIAGCIINNLTAEDEKQGM